MMISRISRTLGLTTAALLLVSTFGCGGGSNSANPPSTPNPNPNPNPPSSTAGVQTFVSSLSAGSTNAVAQTGTPPAESGGPAASTVANANIITGGTGTVDINGSAPFDTVFVQITGIGGYYELKLPAPVPQVSVLCVYPQVLPSNNFECIYTVANGPNVGASSRTQVGVTSVMGGELQVSLSWNNAADVDLHLVEPGGFRIFYAAPTSPAGGTLDLDANAGCTPSSVTAENIGYAGSTPPSGDYQVLVDLFSSCGTSSTPYTLSIRVPGQAPQVITGTLTSASPRRGQVATFTL